MPPRTPTTDIELRKFTNRGDFCWTYVATRPMLTENHTGCGLALNACASENGLTLRTPKENWGAEIRIYEEMCQRADDLNDPIDTEAERAKDEGQKAAILKRKEDSFVAWAENACEPFNHDEALPVPS